MASGICSSLSDNVHTAGKLGPVLRSVFSDGTMFKLLSVVKLFSDLHTL